MNTQLTYDIYSAMQADVPLAIYKKTILGKVAVTVLSPFSGNPEGVILVGDGEDSYVKLWDNKQLSFFEKINRDHLASGRLIKVEAVKPPEPSPNIITDAEIDELLSSPFMKIKAKVGSFTDEAPVLRILNRARELEKSEKLLAFLEKSLSELQFGE